MTDLLSKSDTALDGLVLVGGKSSRMKSAKAHLVFGHKPQWNVCDELLSAVCRTVFFSVSPLLNPPLSVARERLIHDAFLEPIGPLGGIISAFKKNPHASLFVMACDMPNISLEAVQFLRARRNPQKMASVFVVNDEVDPLFGIYEKHILPDLLSAWAHGNLCPRKNLSMLDIERIAPKNPQWLSNINHTAEFEEHTKTAGVQKTITVHYYASLREQAKMNTESLLTSAKTVQDVFLELKRRHGFTIDERVVRFAKNDRMVSSAETLLDHDSVVFIPPVSGG